MRRCGVDSGRPRLAIRTGRTAQRGPSRGRPGPCHSTGTASSTARIASMKEATNRRQRRSHAQRAYPSCIPNSGPPPQSGMRRLVAWTCRRVAQACLGGTNRGFRRTSDPPVPLGLGDTPGGGCIRGPHVGIHLGTVRGRRGFGRRGSGPDDYGRSLSPSQQPSRDGGRGRHGGDRCHGGCRDRGRQGGRRRCGAGDASPVRGRCRGAGRNAPRVRSAGADQPAVGPPGPGPWRPPRSTRR